MIRCNLSVLLAERNLKISDVAKITGISRTTLTALAYNHSKGIQFDTFDSLCNYLKVSPNELFIQEKFNYEFGVKNFDVENNLLELSATIEFKDKEITSYFDVQISVNYESSYPKQNDEEVFITDLAIRPLYSDDIKAIIQHVPRSFITEMEKELTETIKAHLILYYAFDDDLSTHIF